MKKILNDSVYILYLFDQILLFYKSQVSFYSYVLSANKYSFIYFFITVYREFQNKNLNFFTCKFY